MSCLLSIIIHTLLHSACVSERIFGAGIEQKGQPRIMVLTFNQENVDLASYPEALDVMIRSIDDAGVANVIFFCEQEATGSRLAKLLTERPGNPLTGYNYKDAFKEKMLGVTKGHANHQGLSMLYNGDLTKVNFSATRHYLGKGTKTFEGKGGIVAKVTFEYQHSFTHSVAVGCAHLDAKKPETRALQLQQMVGLLKTDSAKIKLLSGDLNFRAKRMADVTTRKTLVDKLSSQQGVNDILSNDTLKYAIDSLGCSCNQPGSPGAMYGPTYKRKPHKPSCRQYNGDFPRSKSVIESCFFDGVDINEELADETDLKNGEHQMGYLDRVCSCGEPVEFVYQKGLEEITVSDHIPILNVVSI
mmetsp:Transcript_3858/g.10298  ORF Transcript_3858/g.10298 Transcript_3858/m.10298 type:complete len:358 (-) Transcript_3858:103-1176(-)